MRIYSWNLVMRLRWLHRRSRETLGSPTQIERKREIYINIRIYIYIYVYVYMYILTYIIYTYSIYIYTCVCFKNMPPSLCTLAALLHCNPPWA